MKVTEHSILPPSSAARRVACPGSRRLEATIESVDNPMAEEGRRAHEVAAARLKYALNGCDPHLYEEKSISESDMIEGAKLYSDYVISKLNADWGMLSKFAIEEKIGITNIHAKCWGTVDCWLGLTFSDSYTVHIFDYKYGHTYVEVFENWQLIEYAAGVLEYIGYPHNLRPISVHLHIVQPRYFGKEGKTREWLIDAKDLEPYFEILRKTESLALQDDAPLIPGKECRFCSAKNICPALKEKSNALARNILESNHAGWVNEEELAKELKTIRDASNILDARLNGLTQEAISMLQSGKRVPGFRLEHSAGREVWKKPAEEIIALGAVYGVDLKKPVDVITPAQAVKLALDADIVKQYSERKTGEAKLVEDKIARKIFGGKK